jgi:hypothetical protein
MFFVVHEKGRTDLLAKLEDVDPGDGQAAAGADGCGVRQEIDR